MEHILGTELYRWYRQAKKQAIANNIDPNDVDWLLQAVTDLSSLSLRMGSFQDEAIITSLKSLPELKQLWQRRLQDRLPVQYLAETVFWRRFRLKVTPAVLIPRPETELIIEIVREVVDSNKSFFFQQQEQNWVDLGTGSGAIALGLADSFPEAKIYGIDSSPAALEVAQENANALRLEDRIDFCCSNWWDKLEWLQGKVTGMISNPPYIPTAEVPKLQPEVAQHEPHSALDGGVDGLDDIRYLVESAPQYLISGGIWLVEVAIGQSDLVVELLNQQGAYYDIEIFSDFNGIERFVLAHRS